jgi:predicted TIM-barrel fold metal-dependent hydrolase
MKAFMPESQILFGTDYAPEPIESTVDQLPGLKLSRAFEQMMLRGNAERLFPRFKLS